MNDRERKQNDREQDNHLDPKTETGAYRITVKKEYGKRKRDKPLWWVVCYHLVVKPLGAAFAILVYLLLALLFRKCGISLPGGHPW